MRAASRILQQSLCRVRRCLGAAASTDSLHLLVQRPRQTPGPRAGRRRAAEPYRADAGASFGQRAGIALAQERVDELIVRLGGRIPSATAPALRAAQLPAAALSELRSAAAVATVTEDRLAAADAAAQRGADRRRHRVALGPDGAGWTVALPTQVSMPAIRSSPARWLRGLLLEQLRRQCGAAGHVSVCTGGAGQSTASGADELRRGHGRLRPRTHVPASSLAEGVRRAERHRPEASLITLQVQRPADGSALWPGTAMCCGRWSGSMNSAVPTASRR